MNQPINLTDYYERIDRLILNLIDIIVINHDINSNLIDIIVINHDINSNLIIILNYNI